MLAPHRVDDVDFPGLIRPRRRVRKGRDVRRKGDRLLDEPSALGAGAAPASVRLIGHGGLTRHDPIDSVRVGVDRHLFDRVRDKITADRAIPDPDPRAGAGRRLDWRVGALGRVRMSLGDGRHRVFGFARRRLQDPDHGVEIRRRNTDRIFQIVIDFLRVGLARRVFQGRYVLVLDHARRSVAADIAEVGHQIVAQKVVLGHPAQTVDQPGQKPRAIRPRRAMVIDRVVVLVCQRGEDLFEIRAERRVGDIDAGVQRKPQILHAVAERRSGRGTRFAFRAQIDLGPDPERLEHRFDSLVGDQDLGPFLVESPAPVEKPLPDAFAVLGFLAAEVPDVGHAVNREETERLVFGEEGPRVAPDGHAALADRRDVPVIPLPDEGVFKPVFPLRPPDEEGSRVGLVAVRPDPDDEVTKKRLPLFKIHVPTERDRGGTREFVLPVSVTRGALDRVGKIRPLKLGINRSRRVEADRRQGTFQYRFGFPLRLGRGGCGRRIGRFPAPAGNERQQEGDEQQKNQYFFHWLLLLFYFFK